MGKQASLNGHKLQNGVFITPLNSIESLQPCSWFTERLPEYLWLGLILNSFEDRKLRLNRIMQMMQRFIFASDAWPFPTMSGLLTLNESLQKNIFQILDDLDFREVLAPLSLIYTYSEYPVFSSYFSENIDFENQSAILESVIRKMADHQSNFATDIRFCVLHYRIVSGKMNFPIDELRRLSLYPLIDHSEEIMRSIRPMIRASEMQFLQINQQFIDDFWKKCGAMFECKGFALDYKKDVSDKEVDKYIAYIKDVFYYYGSLYRIANPLNEKMLVMLGLATYSYKRFLEIVEHNLYNSISGRSIVRVLIEDFVMMKFLLKEEQRKSDIWEEYQSYGMGGLKLVTERYVATNKSPNEKSHLDLRYLNILVDVFKNRLMQNMDTRMFEGGNIKKKFEDVDEKDLYFIYDYDSGFEHGLWGAIRESALLACDTPGHQYHCILDVENLQKMKSVWYDAVMVMNKTIGLLIEEFGISDELKNRMKENGL